MPGYDARKIKRLFGLSASQMRSLRRNGYVQPARDDSGFVYSFQDLVVLRTVSALRAAAIPTRAINRALRELSTGQLALALEADDMRAHIQPIAGGARHMKETIDRAHQHFVRGLSLEDSDAKQARAAYEACLAGDCSHLEARINLGRILHSEGLNAEAERIYRGTKEPDSVLFYNLAIVMEDMGRDSAAVEAYKQAIVHDPGMADAHFNLSLLHERAGEAQAAFRHLLAYRRLDRDSGI
jgi:tetratricopeptide (TPR) repeat protein